MHVSNILVLKLNLPHSLNDVSFWKAFGLMLLNLISILITPTVAI
uniref:Uncharacterized protein n=1 Tax=Rhizophora mucronata TaxID=61149 RepID=A0A2P2J159_RHIMU